MTRRRHRAIHCARAWTRLRTWVRPRSKSCRPRRLARPLRPAGRNVPASNPPSSVVHRDRRPVCSSEILSPDSFRRSILAILRYWLYYLQLFNPIEPATPNTTRLTNRLRTSSITYSCQKTLINSEIILSSMCEKVVDLDTPLQYLLSKNSTVASA